MSHRSRSHVDRFGAVKFCYIRQQVQGLQITQQHNLYDSLMGSDPHKLVLNLEGNLMPDDSTLDRDVTIMVHRLSGFEGIPCFPKVELQRYFAVAGIELHFEGLETDAGPDFFFGASDPVAERLHRDVNLRHQANHRPPIVHCYLSDTFSLTETPYTNFQHINGMLAHPERRAVAIFCNSPTFNSSGNKEATLFQICAHELGHAFNLAHEDGKGNSLMIDAAEVAWDYRNEDGLKRAWAAAKESDAGYWSKIDEAFDYHLTHKGYINCHPLSSESLWRLSMPPELVIPGPGSTTRPSVTPFQFVRNIGN